MYCIVKTNVQILIIYTLKQRFQKLFFVVPFFRPNIATVLCCEYHENQDKKYSLITNFLKKTIFIYYEPQTVVPLVHRMGTAALKCENKSILSNIKANNQILLLLIKDQGYFISVDSKNHTLLIKYRIKLHTFNRLRLYNFKNYCI